MIINGKRVKKKLTL